MKVSGASAWPERAEGVGRPRVFLSFAGRISAGGQEGTSIEKPTSELLPDLFHKESPRIDGDDPVLFAGSLIKVREVQLFLGSDKMRPMRLDAADASLFPAFGSFGILKRIAGSDPRDHYKTIWSKSADLPVWIGSSSYDGAFEEVLASFSTTRFGGARVTRGGRAAVVTLTEAAGLLAEGKLYTRMPAAEATSVPLAVSAETGLLDAVRRMISLNVRRLFVAQGKGRFVSDRTLLDFMFSPERLEVARDRPERWLDAAVSDIQTKTPAMCESASLADAARAMGPAPDDCVMTGDWRVLSRWDMIVKPWRLRRLHAAEDAPAG